MYPAAKNNWTELLIVTAVFGIVTISVMMTLVLTARKGISLFRLNFLERYSHSMAGASILLCGLAIVFLGL
jgi:threonine/homoserine/homoserine lactone efflux protein